MPDGGPFDGPLGVIAGFLALDILRARVHEPRRPVAVVDFVDEEGARFGVACVGSRLLAGLLDPAAALALADAAGRSLGEVLAEAGVRPGGIGMDRQRLAGLAAFVELHVEQGRALEDLGAPVALATGIWPHGRWCLDLAGEANHAGTTRLVDRHDPMLPLAAAIGAARSAAADAGAVATIGRVSVSPNATNAVPSSVRAWLDARAPDEETLDGVVAAVEAAAREGGAQHGVRVKVMQESRTPATRFDEPLRERLDEALGGVPAIPTGAGHDAGILASRVPTAMLFVRNPTGVSHSPSEHAELEDCAAGVRALATVLEDLVRTPD